MDFVKMNMLETLSMHLNSLDNYRPSIDEYFMSLALVVSTRSTCARRRVGAILVNYRNQVLSTGYNGSASGTTHCIDVPCSGVNHESGQGLDECHAVHAEANALVQCPNAFEIETLYVTTSPCVPCVKLLLNTSCQRIVAIEEYPSKAKELWLELGREWYIYEESLYLI